MKILSIQNKEEPISGYILDGLKSENFVIDTTDYETKALCLLEARGYDSILIFDNVQKIDVLELGQKIREINKNILLVMILKNNVLETKINALSIGYDEVLSLNTPLVEISTRLKGLMRRYALSAQCSVLKFSNLEVDTARRTVSREDRIIKLRRKEYELLEYMMHYPEQVLSRRRLLDHVWPEDTFMFTNTVDVHMASIRRKVDLSQENKIIHTIHGVGYKIAQLS